VAGCIASVRNSDAQNVCSVIGSILLLLNSLYNEEALWHRACCLVAGAGDELILRLTVDRFGRILFCSSAVLQE
jgi:hypothetical protein